MTMGNSVSPLRRTRTLSPDHSLTCYLLPKSLATRRPEASLTAPFSAGATRHASDLGVGAYPTALGRRDGRGARDPRAAAVVETRVVERVAAADQAVAHARRRLATTRRHQRRQAAEPSGAGECATGRVAGAATGGRDAVAVAVAELTRRATLPSTADASLATAWPIAAGAVCAVAILTGWTWRAAIATG